MCLSIPSERRIDQCFTAAFKQKMDNLNESKEVDDQNATNIIYLVDYNIAPCIACDACLRRTNVCPLSESDDADKIKELLINADAIILGSPSYFGNVPGIVKNLMDRSRPWKMDGYALKNKLISPVVAAGSQNGFVGGVQDAIIHFALIQGMIVIGAIGNPVIEGNLPAETLQMETLKSFRKPDEIGEIALKSIKDLAQRIDEFLSTK